jgi:uncharacterized protein YjbJ (UPF0337 family)
MNRNKAISQPFPLRRTKTDGDLQMNQETMIGNWNQVKGKVKETWGKLTDDDMTKIDGKRDQLVGTVQRRYGIQKDEAERQIKAFESSINVR